MQEGRAGVKRPGVVSSVGLVASPAPPTIAVATLLALGSAGCFNSGIQPRTADLVPQGKFGGGGSYTVATVAPGAFLLADGREDKGNSGPRGQVHPITYLGFYLMSTQLVLRYGVADGVELSAVGGAQQVGLEVRTRVLDEHARSPVSLTLGFAGMARPLARPVEPWVSAGFDLSRGFGKAVPLFNAAVSYGPERHTILVGKDFAMPCAGFGGAGCGEYAPAATYFVVRRELRLNLALGVAYRDGDYVHEPRFAGFFADDPATLAARPTHYERKPPGAIVTFAIAPYAVLWSQQADIGCDACAVKPVAFRESFGASLVIGVNVVPPR